jgi:hypothetical protein
METQNEKDKLNQLPARAAEYIKQVMHKMRYRRKIRKDVQAELEAHFEDYLKDCKNDAEKGQKAEQLITDFGDVKLLAVLLRRAKKRCRPLWKKVMLRTAQVIGIIFLYLIICIIPMTIGKPTIKIDYVQWLNDKNKAGRDEADNAGYYYDKAIMLYKPLPNWLAGSPAQWPTDFDDSERKSLAEWLASNIEAFETFRKAADCPYYWRSYQRSRETSVDLLNDTVPNINKTLSDYKQVATGVRWQIRYEAYTGDVNQATQDCFALIKFGYDLHGNGFLNEEMFGNSMEIAGLHECSLIVEKVNISTTVLNNMRERLTQLYKKDKPVISLETEKVLWYDLIQRGFTDNGKGDGRVLKDGFPYVMDSNLDWLRKMFLFDRPSRKEALATIEQFFAKSQEFIAKTPNQLNKEGINSQNYADYLPNNLMLKILIPSYIKVAKTAWQLKTQRQGLLTILALMQYKNEKGQYPDDLGQLVSAGYIKQIPSDPFYDGPLIYRKDGDTFTLYSLGLQNELRQRETNTQVSPNDSLKKTVWIYWPVQ